MAQLLNNINKEIKEKKDRFNLLEYAFKNWLEGFEVCKTERWNKLGVDERDILLEHYWQEFYKKYEEIKNKQLIK